MDEYPVDLVPQGAVEDVFTSHVTHQQQFFVHVESRSKILDDIMDKLATRYTDLKPEDKPLYNKRLGSLCAAKFTDDNNWYRAKITGLMTNGLIEVQFVDYGNTDYVSEDRLKAIDPDLVQYPVQSYRCSLADVSCARGFWTPELIIQFEDLVIDRKCRAVFVGENDEVYLLQMYDGDGNSINKMFGATDSADNQAVQNGNGCGGSFKETVFELGAVFEATVVYVKNPGLFWCQRTAYANEILILSEELSRLHMTQDIKPLRNVSQGTVCAAKFSEDEAWYRGVVQSVSGNKAKVYFVDFGNTETVGLDVICNLKPEMWNLPVLGIKCCLANVDCKGGEWALEVIEKFEELALNKEFEVKVLRKEGDVYFVKLLDIVENADVGSQLQSVIINSMKSGIPARDVNSNKQAPSAVSGIGPSFHTGSKVNVFLSWIENPSDFWVQVSDSEELLEQLSQQLQEVYAKQQPLARPSPGAFVVARYTQDNLWYRGLVLKDLDNGQVQVLFIDYGNSDIIPVTDLRQVTAAFGQVVPLASRCCLAGIKPLQKGDKSWTTDAKNYFEKLTENGCLCEVLAERDSHKLVILKVGSQDVGKKLVDLGLVADSTSAVKSQCPSFLQEVTVKKCDAEEVLVTHVDSPQSFWCQLVKNIPALQELMEKLHHHYSTNEVAPVKVPVLGQACIVQRCQDNVWYRASIISKAPSGYDVHFVDYGNKELVPNVYAPELRFLDLPTQAFHCSLPVNGDLTYLTHTLKEEILEKEFKVQVLDVNNKIAIVELFDGTLQVSEYLKSSSHSPRQPTKAADLKPAKNVPLGSTVQAFTSVVVSPSKFFIQVSGTDEELGVLMDNITLLYMSDNPPALVTRPEIGQPCVALYSEDSHWYRGRITAVQENKCTVVFVDYGNEDTVALENIRVLTHDVAEVPVMAHECSLHGLQETAWTESAIQFFESLIMDQELACTFVTSTSVRISCGGQDVADQLVSAGYCKTSQTVMSPRERQSHSNQEREPNSDFAESTQKRQRNSAGFGGIREERSEAQSYRYHDDRDSNRRFETQKRNEDSYGGKQRAITGSFGGERSVRDSRFEGARNNDSGFSNDRDRGESRFGGSRKDRKAVTDCTSTNTSDFTYADIPSQPERCILVHIDENGTFYVQLPSMERDIHFLSKRLAGSYKGGGGPRLKETLARGSVCCARFPLDGSMYRARVEEVNGSRVVVRYVDYGNTEECSVSDLKFLFPDLLQYPVQAFPCVLRGYTFSLDQAEKFAKATLDKDLKVTFNSSTCPFEVDMMTPDGDLLHILTGVSAPPSQKVSQEATRTSPRSDGSGSKSRLSGFGVKSSDTFGKNSGNNSKKSGDMAFTSDQSSKISHSVPKQEFISPSPPHGALAAFISHIGTDGYFYLQLVSDTETLESVSEKLRVLPENIRHPNPLQGASCAAVFSEDSEWYRAIITDKSGDSLSVLFVDFGNEDLVSTGSVKPLSDELLSYPPLAYKCQFSELGPLSPEAQTRLTEYLVEHQVTVTFSGKTSPFDVSLKTVDGKDLQDLICPLKQYRAQTVPTEVTPAGVSHIEKDGRFFLQLYHEYKAVKALQADLNAICEAGEVEKVKSLVEGIPCCLKVENASWERGKLVEIADECAHVFLVDIGKTVLTEVGSIQALPSKLLKTPPFAYECRLKGVDNWAEDLLEKFTEMTQSKILNATFYSKTPPLRVSLARSIELDLLGLAAPLPDSPEKRSSGVTAKQTDLNMKTGDGSEKTEYLEDVESSEEPVLVQSTSTSENVEVMQSSSNVPELVSTEVPLVDISGQRVSVTTPFIVSPGHFYIQLSDKQAGLNEMMDAMLEYYTTLPESLKSADDVKAGDVAAALYEDESWYRVQIQSVADDGTCKIFYMDYGNTETAELASLRPLPDKFRTTSPWALKAKLGGVSPAEGGWTEEAVQEFKNMVEEKSLLADILEVHGSEYVVHLLHMGFPVHEELIRKGYAVAREDLAVSKCVQHFFSDSESAAEATAEESNACLESTHLEEGSKTAKETMMSDGACSELELGKPRGENSANSDMSKVMDVSEIEALEITQPIMESTAVMTDVTPRMTTFTFDEPDERQFRCVKLSLHTEYDVTLSDDELPSGFHIRLLELGDQYLSLMSEIADHVVSDSCLESSHFSPEPGDACLVQHCGVWYRGQVASLESDSWNVRSVDCGWEVNVSAGELKPLPAQFRKLPAQAVPCYLAGIVSVEPEWAEDAITFFMDSVRDAHLCMYVLEDADDEKYGVYLSDMYSTISQSVNRAMVDIGFAEVVPGSNIEVQIEMEKTLDTDALGDLEESFSEISHMKCNAYSGSDKEANPTSTYDYENTLGETYEESKISRTDKMDTDKISAVSQPEGELEEAPVSCVDKSKVSEIVEFNCASAVAMIDRMGCIDNYPDECLSVMYEDLEETESDEGRNTPDQDGGVNNDQVRADVHEMSVSKHQNQPGEEILPVGVDTKSEASCRRTCELVEPSSADRDEVEPQSVSEGVEPSNAGRDEVEPQSVSEGVETSNASRDEVEPQSVSEGVETSNAGRDEVEPQSVSEGVETSNADRDEVEPQSVSEGVEPSNADRDEVEPQSVSEEAGELEPEKENSEDDLKCLEKPVEEGSITLSENSSVLEKLLEATFGSNYDTSSLTFSETCVESSMNISSVGVTSGTETSTCDSDCTCNDSSACVEDSCTSSSFIDSSCTCSTIATSLSDGDSSSWMYCETSSSITDSSTTDTSGFDSPLLFVAEMRNSSRFGEGAEVSTATCLGNDIKISHAFTNEDLKCRTQILQDSGCGTVTVNPKIGVQHAEADIEVNLEDPGVNVQNTEADVCLEDPRISVQSAEADVCLEDPRISVQSAEADVCLEDFKTCVQRAEADEDPKISVQDTEADRAIQDTQTLGMCLGDRVSSSHQQMPLSSDTITQDLLHHQTTDNKSTQSTFYTVVQNLADCLSYTNWRSEKGEVPEHFILTRKEKAGVKTIDTLICDINVSASSSKFVVTPEGDDTVLGSTAHQISPGHEYNGQETPVFKNHKTLSCREGEMNMLCAQMISERLTASTYRGDERPTATPSRCELVRNEQNVDRSLDAVISSQQSEKGCSSEEDWVFINDETVHLQPSIHEDTNDVSSHEGAKHEELTIDAKGDAPSVAEECPN